jgi:ATP-dependent RNA helicase DeaD
MNPEKKIEELLDIALSKDLEAQLKLLKEIKKGVPFWGSTKRIAAALLYEYLGDISNLDFNIRTLTGAAENGKITFEDVKDGKARLFINIGKNHRVSTGDLIKEIVKRSGIDGKMIGKIDIHPTYSFFEIPENFAELVYHSFDGAKIRGISVVVEPAKRRKNS